MELDYTLIGQGIMAAAGVIGGAWLWMQKARTNKADTDAKVEIAQGQEKVYEQLKERLQSLAEQVNRLYDQVDALREQVRERDTKIHLLELHIKDMEHTLRQHGIDPPKLPL